MRDFGTNYFKYQRLTSELEKLRQAEGGVDQAVEDKYLDRLDKIWLKLTLCERNMIDPPRVTLAEGKADFSKMRDLEEHDNDGGAFRMLWHCNYWDGPLSGVVMYKDREHWFECVLEGVVGRTTGGEFLTARAFAIVEMTDEQIAEQRYRHESFEKHVGTHTSYTYENGKRSRQIGAVHPEKDWDKYQEEVKDRVPQDLSGNRIVAWWGSMMSDINDSFYDMMTEDAADKYFLSEEEIQRRAGWPDKWKERDETFRATDPLYLAMTEGTKDDPAFSPSLHGMGVCYDNWCEDFDEEEPRMALRLAYNAPHTVDLEWATKTGPIKVIVYRGGKKTEDKFFWDHSAEGMRTALAYAREVLKS